MATASCACRHPVTKVAGPPAIRKNPNLVPMRLPGHYSVRGDWFIGAAVGSRSQLAAHRAIDILTSRRMNLLCLQDGIGLPARNISRQKENGKILTAMSLKHPMIEQTRKFTLGEIEAMEGRYDQDLPLKFDGTTKEEEKQAKAKEKTARREAFFPLWRSQIKNYDRHSLYFFRWLKNLFLEENQPFIEFPNAEIDSITESYGDGKADSYEQVITKLAPKDQVAYKHFYEGLMGQRTG